MPKKGIYLLFYCFVLGILKLASQPINTAPLVKNYTKQMYQGGTQTWDICEDHKGLVFFANNNGLIVFDGRTFTNFPLPGKTILRSILYDSISHRIYAGGQNEIGYYGYTKSGDLNFVSLAHLLPKEYKGFEDVWTIMQKNGIVYFQTSKTIFAFQNNKMNLLKPSEQSLEKMQLANQKLYVYDAAGAVFELENIAFKQIIPASNLDISAIIDLNSQTLLICTHKNGLYVYKNNILSKAPFNDEELKKYRVYRACKYGNKIVLGTSRSGIFFLDENGTVISKMNIQTGLQNNNVLSLFADKNKNLWLGLDNGIDLLRLNYPFAYIYPDGILKGTGYSMTNYQGLDYFGTNNGLYQHLAGENFKLVKNTEGQVWSVQQIQQKLFVSHHEGLFEVIANEAIKIADIRGCWKILELKNKPGYFVVGTYNGISIYKWINNSLSFVAKPSNFRESSRFIEEDENGNIWVGHPYKGLYKLTLNSNFTQILEAKRYGKAQKLPAETDNLVFNLGNGICFTGKEGVYQYNSALDCFEPIKILGGIFNRNQNYKRIIPGKNGKLWVIQNQEIAYIKQSYNGVDYSYEKKAIPKMDQNLVGGFEFLQECEGDNLFLGVETGFMKLNLKQMETFVLDPPKVIITQINGLTLEDSSYFKWIDNTEPKYIIPDRSIEFWFSSTNGNFHNDLSFSTYLAGWDKTWTPYKTSNNREFSRLSYGDYTLHVKAKCMGVEGPHLLLKFSIPAPWYWSTVAKVFYALFAVLIILLIGFYPQRLVRKKASRIIAEKQDHFNKQRADLLLEKEHKEKELIALKNQQLQSELEHQGRELASSTMHIVQKSEMLLSIKEKLKKINTLSNDPKIKPEMSELIKTIEKDTLIDKDWGKFELYFNQVHNSFTQSLKLRFPSLSANDIKMCSYLRMNLSTKEIASILNITTRGVEVSRYRLRKKMGLENGANIGDFLSQL